MSNRRLQNIAPKQACNVSREMVPEQRTGDRSQGLSLLADVAHLGINLLTLPIEHAGGGLGIGVSGGLPLMECRHS